MEPQLSSKCDSKSSHASYSQGVVFFYFFKGGVYSETKVSSDDLKVESYSTCSEMLVRLLLVDLH